MQFSHDLQNSTPNSEDVRTKINDVIDGFGRSSILPAEPRPFHRDRPVLRFIFNDWKFSGITTIGSGRPVNARVAGDANRESNDGNDRLPGARRNSYTGPDYATNDFRVSRRIKGSERWRMDFTAEIFNLFNRANKRVDVSDDGFAATAATFSTQEKVVENTHYPANFKLNSSFLTPNNAYSPRQIQFALRVKF